jgi:peptidoglycan/LPS O-acetylase OafA/YrhL
LLNYTGLFGFFDPAGDIALGAWSIGDELVYYAVFPFLLLLSRKNNFFPLATMFALALGAVYAFWLFQPNVPIKQQWATYVQPGNHFYFFLGGMAMGLYPALLPAWPTKSWYLFALVLCVGILYFPMGPEPAELLTGWPRVFFSFACFGLVAALFASGSQLPPLPHQLFQWLGTISYGIYLLHPLVFRVLKALNVRSVHWSEGWLIPATVVITLIISHVSWHWFEKPLLQKK